MTSTPTAQLSGTVAVGAPITGGTLRVIDVNGTVVASGITVADDGSYSVPTLSGSAPYRIEACGYAGPNYQCIYSVTQGPGTANVTPLTTATVQLATNLPLTGLETLFGNMSAAVQSAEACGHASAGMASSMASSARMSDEEGGSLSGAAQVGAGLCAMFTEQQLFGSRLLSPTLGRCDFSGAEPVCRVSFVLQSPEGSVEAVGQGMGVTREGGVWKFLGDLNGVQIHASAKAQRDVTYQDGNTSITYARAIAFDIPALTGLQCAQVTQRDASLAVVTVAYYKNYGGGAQRLSLWQQNAMSNQRSLDPLVGALRSGDDTWVTLPDGNEGDAVVRNFFRGGRAVTVSLFSDSNCTTAFLVSGQSVFEVEVEGVPPTTAQLPNLPWTDLTPTARQALFDLTLAANASGSYSAA